MIKVVRWIPPSRDVVRAHSKIPSCVHLTKWLEQKLVRGEGERVRLLFRPIIIMESNPGGLFQLYSFRGIWLRGSSGPIDSTDLVRHEASLPRSVHRPSHKCPRILGYVRVLPRWQTIRSCKKRIPHYYLTGTEFSMIDYSCSSHKGAAPQLPSANLLSRG